MHIGLSTYHDRVNSKHDTLLGTEPLFLLHFWIDSLPENFHIEISRKFLGCNQGLGAEISKNLHSEIEPNGWVNLVVLDRVVLSRYFSVSKGGAMLNSPKTSEVLSTWILLYFTYCSGLCRPVDTQQQKHYI